MADRETPERGDQDAAERFDAFVSHAQDPFPIFVWSRTTYWTIVAAISLMILGAYVALGRPQQEFRRSGAR